jgi:parallel beta-helix repeat protein
MKVQIATNYPTDSANMVISGNVIESVGSHGILLTNTLGGGTTRTRRAIVSNNVVSDTADDGINVQDGINVLVSDNVISDCRAGVLVADSSQVTVSGNHVVGARRQGVTVSNASQVWVVRNRIHNPASDNEASYEFGISAFSSGGITDLVIAGNEVIDALGNMRYGLYVSGDTSTFEFYDNRSTGATDYGARFGTAGAVRRWDGNTFSGTLGAVLNWPTSGAGVSGGERFGDAAPASGSFQRGDLVWNRLPSPAGSVGWVCTTAGAASSTAWAASTAYLVNDVVYNGTRVYRCTVAGTSDASGGPTGTGSAIADGTVTWAHVATRAVFKTFGLIES